MQKTIRILFALALLLIPSALAINLTAPSRVPESNVWGFSIGFGPLDSFFDAEVVFDGQKLFSYSNGTIIPDPIGNARILTADTRGSMVVVSLLGQPTGNYELIARTRLSGGQVIEEKNATVSFVSIMDETDRSQLMFDLNQMRNAVEEIRSQIQELSDALSNQGNLNEEQATQLSENAGKLQELQDSLTAFQQSLAAYSEFDASVSTQLSEIKTSLNDTAEQVNAISGNPTTGFFGFTGANSLWIALFVIGIIAVGFFFIRSRNQAV